MENNGNRSYQDQSRNRDSDWQNRNSDNDRERDRFRSEQGNRNSGNSSDWSNDNRYNDMNSSPGSSYGRSGDDYNRYGNSGSHRNDDRSGSSDYNRGNSGRNFENTGYSGRGDDRRNSDRDRDWVDRTADEISSWFGDDDAKRRRRMDKINGPHRGKGPKGYTRSDDKIKEEINEKLYHDSHVDASDIDVTVSNGEVTLSGTVDSREAKYQAEDVAESITGVNDVTNHLKVNKTSGIYNSGATNMDTTPGNRSGINGITENNDNNRRRSTTGV